MMLGLSLHAFTAFHVFISLVGIISGLIVVLGMLGGKPYRLLTGIFLATTLLTSLTGFLFPFEGFKPSYVVGILSVIVLILAIVAYYPRHLAGPWRATYVVTAVVALYFNFFVLIVQSFLKVPSLHALAPTQKEPPFAIAQLAALIIFILLGILSVRKFHPGNS
jgi:hypothetical protein